MKNKSIKFNIISSITICFLLVMGCIIYINISDQRSHIKAEVLYSTNMLAESVYNGMLHPMSVGDSNTVLNQMGDIKKNMDEVEVLIFGSDKQVVYATEKEKAGNDLDKLINSNDLEVALAQMLEDGKAHQIGYEEVVEKKPYLTVLRPILNENRCYHCHGSSHSVLGGLMVRHSIEKMYMSLSSLRNKNIIIGFFGILITVIALFLLISRLVNKPIKEVIGDFKKMSDDIADGKLDSRADVEAVGIDFKAIPAGFNNTLDAVINPLNVMAEYVDRISKGDIPEKITDDYKGDFNEVKNNLNILIDAENNVTEIAQAIAVGNLTVKAEKRSDNDHLMNALNKMIDPIKALVAEAGMLKEAAIEGKLDTRGDVSKFGGDFGKIVQGVNDTLDAVIGPLNVAAEYVDRISKGDIPEEITDEYKGDFNEVKNNLNVCIDALNSLVAEAGMLRDAGVEGKLDTRGDDSKFGGDFGKIVQGVNDTLDAVIVPINEAMGVIQAMADRDLTKKVVGIYKGRMKEFKGDINNATESLHNALSQASAAADQVGSASGQIASSSQQLAEGSAEQASSLEETSSSLEEMASMVKQNADNANQANKLMHESGEVIKRATQSMGDLTTSMEDISQASEETQKIIKTIDEIAFQTNLLALNAAVEAARAGEAGAGFAVVAEEVRNLAMRSADAAKNTAGLIEGTVKKVKAGSDLVEKTGGEFNEVAESSGKVSVLVDEIDVASSEQSKGIEEVNKAVAEMDKVTQQNAANAEESASASEEMSGQAQELNSMLASFKLNGDGAERKQITTADPKPEVHNVKKTKTKQNVNPETIIPMDDAADDASFKDF